MYTCSVASCEVDVGWVYAQYLVAIVSIIITTVTVVTLVMSGDGRSDKVVVVTTVRMVLVSPISKRHVTFVGIVCKVKKITPQSTITLPKGVLQQDAVDVERRVSHAVDGDDAEETEGSLTPL